MNKFTIDSYSKINLGLRIINKRKDGFHDIESIFIRLNLKDKLIFTPSEKFSLTCNISHLNNFKKNIVYKTYVVLDKMFDFKHHYSIQLYKQIPIGGGMGGGSSNAAATMIALNKLNNLNLKRNQLQKIAIDLGSDVPFFLDGKIQKVTGKGEYLKKIKGNSNFDDLKFLIIIPPFQISTKWAYTEIKNYLEPNNKRSKFPPLDKRVDWKLFENDFELVVQSAYPEIKNIKHTMYSNGALFSSLSGSGSTMFGIYNDIKFVKKTQNKLKHYKTFIASPI